MRLMVHFMIVSAPFSHSLSSLVQIGWIYIMNRIGIVVSAHHLLSVLVLNYDAPEPLSYN